MAELKIVNSLVDDRYEIIERTGQGSYAEIFLARDRAQANQLVILKALNTELQGTLERELEELLIDNFNNEATALKLLEHPNIIYCYDFGNAIDLTGLFFHYLVLEYLPGGDLLQKCKTAPLDLNRLLYYLEQVCGALSHIHARKIIHRDIKPNNLLLSTDHQIVKIADLGVAKLASPDCSEITRVGTDIYAPPEHHPSIVAGVESVQLTPAADLYSLAKTVYTLLTGSAPQQFKNQPITELPEPLWQYPWAAGLLAVLRRATQTEVEQRYQSASEFFQALSEVATAAEPLAKGHRPKTVVPLNDDSGAIVNGLESNFSDARIVIPVGQQATLTGPLSRYKSYLLALLSLLLIGGISVWGYHSYRQHSSANQPSEKIKPEQNLSTVPVTPSKQLIRARNSQLNQPVDRSVSEPMPNNELINSPALSEPVAPAAVGKSKQPATKKEVDRIREAEPATLLPPPQPLPNDTAKPEPNRPDPRVKPQPQVKPHEIPQAQPNDLPAELPHKPRDLNLVNPKHKPAPEPPVLPPTKDDDSDQD